GPHFHGSIPSICEIFHDSVRDNGLLYRSDGPVEVLPRSLHQGTLIVTFDDAPERPVIVRMRLLIRRVEHEPRIGHEHVRDCPPRSLLEIQELTVTVEGCSGERLRNLSCAER